MTDANTPRTAAEMRDYAEWANQVEDFPIDGEDAYRAISTTDLRILRGYAATFAALAEAAAPTPESGWPFHTNEELEALTPRKPAEPLDMERLALAIANVSGDGRVLDVDREETRKVATEYNRLAAARPEADR